MTATNAPATSSPDASAQPWLTHSVSITKIVPEIDSVATYTLQFQDESARQSYQFAAGQFNMLYLPGAGESAISVSGDPCGSGGLEHTIRTAGNVTSTLARLSVGDALGLRGPFGTSWPVHDCLGKDLILVAGGIGLAPLRPVICSVLNQRESFGRVHLLYGARSPGTLLFENQYDEWSQRGLQLQTTVDRSATGWSGNVGVVTLLLDRLADFDSKSTTLLCCGPEVMMRFAVRSALGLGLSAKQIWISMERNMQCAVGLCGHCQLGPEFICKDGPVFRYDRIAPLLNVEGL